MFYLLDSVVILWYIRNLHSARDIIAQLSRDGRLAASAISVLEVGRAIDESEERAARDLFTMLEITPVDRAVVGRAIAILRQAWAQGYRMDYISAIVSATAAENDMVLVTYNIMHYPVTDVSIFPLESLVA